MSMLTGEQILKVKAMGFLLNRGTNKFSGRVVGYGTVFTAENFKALSLLADTFGDGKLIPTSRQSIEVTGIPYEKIEAAVTFAEGNGLYFGGTGNKVRPITACKGTTCIFGNFDTQSLAQKIHDTYYLGWKTIQLPHKFKIAVGGCPNSCIKPSLNDFGIEGQRVATGEQKLFKIYVGGTWGKSTRMGTPLSRLVTEEETLSILEKTMLWFKKNAYSKERFGLALDRVGFENFEKNIFSNVLLESKDEILAMEINKK